VHKADSAASALSAALLVITDSFRFSLAIHGMIAAAAIKIAIPEYVVLGSLYPCANRKLATTPLRARHLDYESDYGDSCERLHLP
jgi:hypothetical protein